MRRRQQYGEDIEKRVNISLKDVLKGIKKEIQFERYIPCSSCDGTGGTSITCDRCHGNGQVEQVTQSLFGRVMQVTTCPKCRGEGKMITNKCTECNGKKVVPETKTISPNIPAGVETGQQLKLQGMGHIPSKNAVPGDLYIIIIVKPHKNFERDGTSILSSISITFLQAIKGSQINVKTIDGSVKLKIPPGTQSGNSFKLREKGLPRLNRPKFRGIHYVTVEVENPKYEKLSSRAKEIIDELTEFVQPINEINVSTSKKGAGKKRKR
jgi:molecular chaperone DnaJ